jgi:glutaredoxin 3
LFPDTPACSPRRGEIRHAGCIVLLASCRPRKEQSAACLDHARMATQSQTQTRELPVLYTKAGCPWCEEAVRFLDEHGVGYRLKEVTGDAAAFAEMQEKSGQTRAPTLDWHGKILADFGSEELVPFLLEQNVKLEDS